MPKVQMYQIAYDSLSIFTLINHINLFKLNKLIYFVFRKMFFVN